MPRKVPRRTSPVCTGTVTLRAGSSEWMRRQWLPDVRETTNPARTRALMTSLALSEGSRHSCRKRDCDLADARGLSWGNRFTPRRAIGQHQADRILGHGERFALILAISHDLGQARDAHGEATLVFGLKHDREGAGLIHGDAPFHEDDCGQWYGISGCCQ